MKNRTHRDGNLWSVILAGGEGERLKPMVQRWLGRHKPKQYCTFIGTRSMLEHTLDRADQITAPERKVTIIAKTHREDAWPQLDGRNAGKVILQPANRGTAPGIFLALAVIRSHDPEATVVLFPSDHFVYPEDRFTELVRNAVETAKQMKHWLILLGVHPAYPDPEYGWIYPGAHVAKVNGHYIRAVESFLEKPASHKCQDAMTAGALWNTLVVAGKVETFWTLGKRYFPEMMALFGTYGQSIETLPDCVLEALYELIPVGDFSSGLLERVPEQMAVMELNGVLWCDWGKPARIVETLSRIGRQPAFPLEHATALSSTSIS